MAATSLPRGLTGVVRGRGASCIRRIAGSSNPPQPPILEDNDPVEAAGELEIVCRDQGGEAGTADQIDGACLGHFRLSRCIPSASFLTPRS